jgi:hypothetical protein
MSLDITDSDEEFKSSPQD